MGEGPRVASPQVPLQISLHCVASQPPPFALAFRIGVPRAAPRSTFSLILPRTS
jgi:hypothetical protein